MLTGARDRRPEPRLLDRALLLGGMALVGWFAIELLSKAYGVEATGSLIHPLLALLD